MHASKGHIVILGTSHNVQGGENWHGQSLDDTQFKSVLNNLVRGKDFLFEEATGLGPTTAEHLALSRWGAGHYLDIDPPLGDREALGIPQSTGDSVPIDTFDADTDSLCSELIGAQEKREEVWLGKIQVTAFDRGLLLCGFLHALSMSFRLRAAGYTVEAFHYLPWRRFCQKWREVSG